MLARSVSKIRRFVIIFSKYLVEVVNIIILALWIILFIKVLVTFNNWIGENIFRPLTYWFFGI